MTYYLNNQGIKKTLLVIRQWNYTIINYDLFCPYVLYNTRITDINRDNRLEVLKKNYTMQNILKKNITKINLKNLLIIKQNKILS